MLMHKPLIFIEEHNKEMEILKREFFDPSATKEENYKSYLELCDNLAKILPTITPPSFEDWMKNPQRIFDIRESHNWGADFDSACDEILSEPASKEEIMEEIINCILKKLNISIDIESIKHCIEVTRNMDCLDYITMSSSPQEIDMAASFIKLKEHDFIKKEG